MKIKVTIQIVITLLYIFFCAKINAQVYEYPYVADFEYPLNQSGWSTGGSSSWELGDPHPTNLLQDAYSGIKCWATNVDGNYSDYENGYIISPEFDFSELIEPKLEFWLWHHCGDGNDGAVFQYSLGDGSWQNVGGHGDENWFNSSYIDSYPGGQEEGWTMDDENFDYEFYGSGWQHMSHSIATLAGLSNISFRLIFSSDSYNTGEGFAFDLFRLYDDAIAYIPDTQFEQYLLDNSLDSDGIINGQVLKSDISGVTNLNISGYNISNFEGLQFFTALTHFTLIDNLSTSSYSINFDENLLLQEVTISNSPELDQVWGLVSENLISISISTNGTYFSLGTGILPNLISLNIEQSSIYSFFLNSFSTPKFPNLTYLNIANNPLVDLDFSSLSQLQVLEMNNTSVQYLDLSSNLNLTQINSSNGALLEVKLNNGFNNLLTSVEFNNNPSLECIQVDDPTYSNSATGWIKDVTATYSENCGFSIRDFPYFEDFENGNNDWQVVNINNSSWELGTPASTNLNTSASGSNAWVTNLDGYHNANENSYVLSPEFNFSSFDGFDELYAQLDIWYNLETGVDGVVLQSSIDGGSSWQNVGSLDTEFTTNQYNFNDIAANPGSQPIGWSDTSENIFSNGWKRTVFNIGGFAESSLVGELSVYFRIAFGSNGSIENEGFAFDNFRIAYNSCYAGEDVSHENICSNNNINLYNYLNGINWGGNVGLGIWTSLDGLQIMNGFEIYPSSIQESGNYRFKFTISSYDNCTDESIIELIIEKKQDVGNDSEFFDNNITEGCSDLSFEDDAAFQQWAFDTHVAGNSSNVDPGGIWSPSSFQGYRYYTYMHLATSTCPETSSTFLYNKQDPIETYEYIQTTSDVSNLYILIEEAQASKNSNKLAAFSRRGKFRSPQLSLTDDGEVDFPNTGTGPYYETYNIDYIIEDDCGSIESITHYVISVLGVGNGGENGILSKCSGDSFTEEDLFNALEGNPSNIGYWTPDINGPGIYTYWYEPFQGEDIQFWEQGGTVTVTETPLLKLSMLLQGPYNTNNAWMNNDLWKNNLIVEISPYQDAMELPLNYSFSESIVDWIWLEVRDANNQNILVLERSALLKRNGDVVFPDTDGIQKPLLLNVPTGDYNISVNHRNHLGVITANPINISCGTLEVDFTKDNSLINGGENGIKTIDDGNLALIAGDVNGDGIVQYSGASPEGPGILSYVLNDPSNFLSLPTFSIAGYSNTDVNLDGQTQYAGGNSEMPIILQNVLSNPTNFLDLITWPIEEQIPSISEE